MAGEIPTAKEVVFNRLTGGKDDSTLALVAEGGGNRGVLSALELSYLVDTYGINHDTFDFMVGSSAGIYNLLGFCAGKLNEGGDFYAKEMQVHFSWPSIIKNKGIDSVSLYEEYVRTLGGVDRLPLNKLHVVATNVETYKSDLLGPFESAEKLQQAVLETTAIPLVTGKPVLFCGSRYYDGALLAPVPVVTAIDKGATHVLVVATRNTYEWKDKQSFGEAALGYAYQATRYPGIQKEFENSIRQNSSIRLATESGNVWFVEPPVGLKIPNLGKLTKGMVLAAKDAIYKHLSELV